MQRNSSSKICAKLQRAPGEGVYPSCDMDGTMFSSSHEPERFRRAGSQVLPGFVCILEGIQADQDFCRAAFKLDRYYTKKQCCHSCGVLGWLSSNPRPGEANDPNDLYTVYGLADGQRGTFGFYQTRELEN